MEKRRVEDRVRDVAWRYDLVEGTWPSDEDFVALEESLELSVNRREEAVTFRTIRSIREEDV